MGQISEDILDGTCCQFCGRYFTHPKKDSLYTHGHPVVCYGCWEEMPKKEKINYERAKAPTL